MSTITPPSEQRVVLRAVSWQLYAALAEDAERTGRLMTYDRGQLEIMSPSRAHESDKSMLGRMVERFAEIRGIDIASSASTTFKRSDLQRAFEADESYYIQHEAAVRATREIDLAVDPPPDLVIEVEITRSALDKLALFAAMGIPEVWLYDGHKLWLGLRAGEGYEPISESTALPGFPVAEADATLRASGQASETELIRRFVAALDR